MNKWDCKIDCKSVWCLADVVLKNRNKGNSEIIQKYRE